MIYCTVCFRFHESLTVCPNMSGYSSNRVEFAPAAPSPLLAPARAVLAAWDRIEEAKSASPLIEDRLAAIRPMHDEFQAALSALRDALTE